MRGTNPLQRLDDLFVGDDAPGAGRADDIVYRDDAEHGAAKSDDWQPPHPMCLHRVQYAMDVVLRLAGDDRARGDVAYPELGCQAVLCREGDVQVAIGDDAGELPITDDGQNPAVGVPHELRGRGGARLRSARSRLAGHDVLHSHGAPSLPAVRRWLALDRGDESRVAPDPFKSADVPVIASASR